jgi:thioredoxin 1
MIKNLDKNNFNDTVAEGVHLVDFWAAWCGPCRMMNPILEQYNDENTLGVQVAKVNVDEQQELAMKFGISSIPAMLIFKNG